MDFSFLSNFMSLKPQSAKDMASTVVSTSTLMEVPKQKAQFDAKFWKWTLFSFVPWAKGSEGNIQMPTTVNKKLKRRRQSRESVNSLARTSTIRFRPYVSKVPWHTGPRAFLSQFFPRYGHYCGPNWSSGKDGGSLVWDRRPIDWLDFCCYCHDMGYDTHDQAELLKADLAFLECLEKPHMSTRGDPHTALLYKTMCISGLRNILIPYRQRLISLQANQLSFGFGWLSGIMEPAKCLKDRFIWLQK
ncbi:uncharacterized protein LOC107775715 [Nicotiana tabacum]|uniref:Uncharacterized protein LOC107775715 n=2 Tax=Nicotiana TaxID=4085 RepID=A0A1S3YFR4_TOBAC|nr:PREDICTED: uncharacterized protein LOC104238114 [Nicotiana sylvestris]XP_016450950.1 PREDICTED: uncharacterized protein LOC107775715 [Nicotiana tabacum]